MVSLLDSSDVVSCTTGMLAEASELVDTMCWGGINAVVAVDMMCEFSLPRIDAGADSISTSVYLALC
jgi:hypothetical protein